MALEVLNNELPKPKEERGTIAAASFSVLAALEPELRLNEDCTKIEFCQFYCDACQAAVGVEDSDPLIVVGLPDACPERPAPGDIRIAEL